MRRILTLEGFLTDRQEYESGKNKNPADEGGAFVSEAALRDACKKASMRENSRLQQIRL
jgi:hypothetical protein